MRVVDLFSGCGGMSAGMQSADHEVVFAAENWSVARRVYDANFDHPSVPLDLQDVIDAAHRVSRERPDIIVGGPPCQDFSAAGLRQEAERADLTIAFADIIKACSPKYFVMENVPAATSSVAFKLARHRLVGAGYGITQVMLDASVYGVPQLRKRVFLIGRLEEEDDFLATELEYGRPDAPATVRQYLGH